MYNIMDYMANLTNTPCIWVSHHAGYNQDEYTIPESTVLLNKLGVQGAPNVVMNRTKIMGMTKGFHPDYLVEEGMADMIAYKCDTVAEASVVIDHTYNAEKRELNVTVSGQVADAAVYKYNSPEERMVKLQGSFGLGMPAGLAIAPESRRTGDTTEPSCKLCLTSRKHTGCSHRHPLSHQPSSAFKNRREVCQGGGWS